jgi:hypothetical protein
MLQPTSWIIAIQLMDQLLPTEAKATHPPPFFALALANDPQSQAWPTPVSGLRTVTSLYFADLLSAIFDQRYLSQTLN